MTPTISSLLSRVRAASGPDRELDADIGSVIVLGGPSSRRDWGFTENINETIDLAEFKGYAIHTIHRSKSGLWSVTLEPNGESEGLRLLPLAILAALLSALEQKESAG